jgi:hypothetical protein
MCEKNLTRNMIKWMNPEFRKEYNRTYHEKLKLKQGTMKKVECPLCHRKVSNIRLVGHQTTNLCINNRETEDII